MSAYEPAMTMRDARAQYFEDNHFGDDGGYNDTWVKLKLGPVPLYLYNGASRRYAVRFHDLHHILTGYRTDWPGEFEISAWEIAAGCADAGFAWFINLQGMLAGMVVLPGRTARAFYRGRHSQSLYRYPFDGMLDATVAELRDRSGVDRATSEPTLGDRFALALWTLIAFLSVVPQLAILLAPFFLLGWWLL